MLESSSHPGLLWLALVLMPTACGGLDAAAPSDVDPRPAELGERMEDVGELRSRADEEIDAAMTVLRGADDAMARARRPPLVLQELQEAADVREQLAGLAPEQRREELRELAGRIDETRALVRQMQDAVTENELWRRASLDAQDTVLRALREHLAAGDALWQLIDRHRAGYDGALGRLEELEKAEHEDATAAARAAEQALDEVGEAVALARDELEEFAQRRRATARAVNEAAADAATVAEQRP